WMQVSFRFIIIHLLLCGQLEMNLVMDAVLKKCCVTLEDLIQFVHYIMKLIGTVIVQLILMMSSSICIVACILLLMRLKNYILKMVLIVHLFYVNTFMQWGMGLATLK